MTSQQKRTLDFIVGCLKSNGVPPSFEEIRVALGLSSKANVYRMLLALEEQGLISRTRNRARSIEVIERGSSDYQRGFDRGVEVGYRSGYRTAMRGVGADTAR